MNDGVVLTPPKGRIRGIESLRAVAALSILAYHAAFASEFFLSKARPLHYAWQLDVGVTIFFLISGFLLYRPFVRSRVFDTRPPWVERYVASRFLRIVPAYWLALAVIAVWLSLDEVGSLTGILTYFGFFQVYSPDTWDQGLPQAWSLCVEVGFYAFLPIWALVMRRGKASSPAQRLRREWLGVTALFALGTAWNLTILATHDPTTGDAIPFLYSFPAYLDLFAIGMAVAVLVTAVEVDPRVRSWLSALNRFPMLAILLSVIALWVAATQIGLEGGNIGVDDVQWEVRHLLFGLIALGLLLPTVLGQPGRGFVRKLLTTRVGSFLGDISYGIFLWHIAVLTQLDRSGFDPVIGGATVIWMQWTVVTILLTVPIAAASWYLIERPALSLRDRLARRLRREKPVPPPPVTREERETDIAAP